jgi:hypothetical protein
VRFLISPPQRISEGLLELAYLSGPDRTPWSARARLEGAEFVLQRDSSDSGCLTIPWPVEQHGLLGLSTATLVERDEPYLLPLELARGTINQFRNQLFEWQMIGLAVPAVVTEKLAQAVRQFSVAVSGQQEPGGPEEAERALRTALDGAQLLAAAYAEQASAVRRRATGRLPALLGGELTSTPLEPPLAAQFLAAFNAAAVQMSWREVETSEGSFSWSACDRQIDWCRAAGLKIFAGPLVQLDDRGLPDWAYIWEDDWDNLLAAAGQFVRAAVSRYRGKVDLWLGAGRANTSQLLSLTEEENLRLAAAMLRLVGSLDPQTPRAISIDQPWGEYMGRQAVDFAPLQFADALVRANLDLRAFVLELNLGCFAGATLPRPELELSRQLDYWSLLGLPLLVSLSIPSADGEDPLARRKVAIPPGSWSPESQQAWAARYVPLLLAKPCVQGVFWNQFRDDQPHDFPHAGLMAELRQPKPALKTLAAMRSAWLAPLEKPPTRG